MNMGLVQSIADLSSRWRSRFSRSKELSEHLQLGARGEKLACGFLRRQGYKILYRNFRARHGGEVDIVCRDGDTLVFIEVKTRRRDDTTRPSEAINAAKRKLISRGALTCLQLLDNPRHPVAIRRRRNCPGRGRKTALRTNPRRV
jgi:Holliday junction resolvase-like predicted endonuclease